MKQFAVLPVNPVFWPKAGVADEPKAGAVDEPKAGADEVPKPPKLVFPNRDGAWDVGFAACPKPNEGAAVDVTVPPNPNAGAAVVVVEKLNAGAGVAAAAPNDSACG